MRCIMDFGELTLFLEGAIDANNATEIEAEILEAAKDKTFQTLVLDFEKVHYISSAGLRMMLTLKKKFSNGFRIINTSTEVYEIFDMTSFTSAIDIRKALREIDVSGCEVIGQGGNGTVYRLDDDKIVKVYGPEVDLAKIRKEQEYAKTALLNGLPCVIAYDVVHCVDRFGIVFELIKSNTLSYAMKTKMDDLDVFIEKYVKLAKELHSANFEPGVFVSLKEMLHGRIKNLSAWCAKEEMDLLHSLIDELPDSGSIIHGDLHPGNIMIQDGELLLIDMPEVTVGSKLWDLVGIYRTMIIGAQKSPEFVTESVGMPADLIIKVGDRFFKSYLNITSDIELLNYYKKLNLLYSLNVVLVLGRGSPRAVARAESIVDNLLRGVVIPNEQIIRHLLKTM